jgi:hypothetical protein
MPSQMASDPLVTSYAQRLNAKRYRKAFRKVFRCAKQAFNKLAILFHIGLVLMGRRIVAKLNLSGKYNDISSLLIPIKIE